MTYSPDRMQLARYEVAVYENPRKPGEGFTDYIVRIAELVAKGTPPAPVQGWSDARLPYKDPA